MIWIMLGPGPERWQLIKAAAPCWKGELRGSLYFFGFTIGWQSQPKGPFEMVDLPVPICLTCKDCDAPYGKDGWCDVVVPNEIWNAIADDAGVLCFRCMTKRIEAHGFDNVPVIVASGPYVDANEEWRLIGLKHGYGLALSEREEAKS